MSIRTNKYKVKNLIVPKHVLVSVFDKSGLLELVQAVLYVNPDAMFYSTGGTEKKIIEALSVYADSIQIADKGFVAAHYTSVELYTGAPEMEGGLVKTLHPKIHAGLLGERGNSAHEDYLQNILPGPDEIPGVYFDVLVGNLYPFVSTVRAPDCTPEKARVNIDIGGPTMIRAAAKNWLSIAVVSDVGQYSKLIEDLLAKKGTDLEMRFGLMQDAFELICIYDLAIADYNSDLDYARDVRPMLDIEIENTEVNHG